jgi:nicotinamide-nucleotide amidase
MERVEILTALAEALLSRGWSVACAESCTGGGISAALTDIAGSSAWFDRGFVTYSNDAKRAMLGVAAQTILAHGAVSRETVMEMARGALRHSKADLSVAVSGIAGPGGGSDDKPVGTVWLSWAGPGFVEALGEHFDGDRAAVRAAAVDAAVRGLLRHAR